MGLKQSIVIVNEFTHKMSGGGGTRGATPGDYVLRYMARNGAVEDLTPITFADEPFMQRYASRAAAVDDALSVPDLKEEMRKQQGDGGVAFGYGEFSLSHKKLRAAAKDIQRQFDSGKTVMKTVLSFDTAYLKQWGVVSEDFSLEDMGTFRGNIDQMKLRMAIMDGIDRMAKSYDDLQYVGVIQVDTQHVHCHLAMVDRGVGNLMPDGTQRGKILPKEKAAIRRGVDRFFEEKQKLKAMSANTDFDRRNTICFVKKYTHRAMDNRGFSQFLLACLPNDRQLWRADSDSREMRKANAIMREYVQELLDLPDSGYREALQRVDRYARNRARDDGSGGEQYRRLVAEGQKSILYGCMDAAYSVLQQVPSRDMEIRTPMMEVMALPYDNMASEADSDPMIEFGFKLRSYHSRLGFHRKERHKYHDMAREYERQKDAGDVDPSSRPLYDYFKIEEEYNAMLMAKYQHFLNFIPPEDAYMQGFEDIMAFERSLENTRRMYADKDMPKMRSSSAEDYGVRVYGESGGRYAVIQPSALEARIQRMEHDLEAMRTEYGVKLADYGMRVGVDGRPEAVSDYEFDEVKALDLHHLMYDFPYDFPISGVNVDRFMDMAERRARAFDSARDYLERSGQSQVLAGLPVSDIAVQRAAADRFKGDALLYTMREKSDEKRAATRTIRMDHSFYDEHEDEMKIMIKNTINSLQYEL